MDPFRKIVAVALYEARTLWRSWFVRIFGVVILLALIGLNALVLGAGQINAGAIKAIPANLPYLNMLLLNVVQALVAVIVASDFLKRDCSLDTTDVVYIRSMTNTGYVVGKACGNLLIFAGLDIAALLAAGLFNFFSADVPMRLGAYCWYPLLICLPTLVFCIGCAFCLMSITRSQPLSLVIIFGCAGTALFFLRDACYSVFDFAALSTPLMISDLAGFGGLGPVVILRASYLLLGLGFVLIAALRLKRLPQSTGMTRATVIVATALLGGACALAAVHAGAKIREQQARARMIEQHNRYFDAPAVSVVHDDCTFIHRGSSIEVFARLTLANQTSRPIDEYLLRLNPGLRILEVAGGRSSGFRRSLDFVFVKPSGPLAPGALDTISVRCRGSIDESACYLDLPADEMERGGAVFFLHKQPRFAFIEKRLVVLTPETQFYPQAGAGYCSDHPESGETNLTTFRVAVLTDPSLTAFSQGKPARGARGDWVFEPTTPLPGISVIVGPYTTRTVVADSVHYSLATLAAHDRFQRFFRDLPADTIASLIRGMRADFEDRVKIAYPYSRFIVVETPLQFTDFQRLWTSGRESMQPEMALAPENGFSLADADFNQMSNGDFGRRQRQQEVLTPTERQSRIFQRIVSATFTRDNAGRAITLRPQDRTSPAAMLLQWLPPVSAVAANLFIFPDYFSYAQPVHAPWCPVFSQALESYFKKRVAQGGGGMMRAFFIGASTDEKVNGALQNAGFGEICKDPDNRTLVPDVVRSLGDYLFALLQKNIGDLPFEAFMQEIVDRNRFKVLDLEEFCATIRQRFAFDFKPYLLACYRKHPLPGFLLGAVEATGVRDTAADRFLVRLQVANPESADGLIRISVRAAGGGFGEGRNQGGGNRGGGGFGGGSSEDRIIAFAPRQCKEIGIMTDRPPRMVSISTFISRNIPATITRNFDKVEPDPNGRPFDGERTIDSIAVHEPGTVVVDDQDSGFSVETRRKAGILGGFAGGQGMAQDRFAAIRFGDPPDEWTETAGPMYYGSYVHSARYIKAGRGEKRIAWKAAIRESGTYSVFTYYTAGFQRFRGGQRRGGEELKGSYHFIVHHDDGAEKVALDLKDMQNGWNSLGHFHLSPGTWAVELSDEGSEGIIVGDAIKWARQQ
jgi:hypothetical protein